MLIGQWTRPIRPHPNVGQMAVQLAHRPAWFNGVNWATARCGRIGLAYCPIGWNRDDNVDDDDDDHGAIGINSVWAVLDERKCATWQVHSVHYWGQRSSIICLDLVLSARLGVFAMEVCITMMKIRINHINHSNRGLYWESSQSRSVLTTALPSFLRSVFLFPWLPKCLIFRWKA